MPQHRLKAAKAGGTWFKPAGWTHTSETHLCHAWGVPTPESSQPWSCPNNSYKVRDRCTTLRSNVVTRGRCRTLHCVTEDSLLSEMLGFDLLP